MAQFQIKRGLSENLKNAELIDGCWYLTKDSDELFVCSGGQLNPIIGGGVRYYNSTSELPIVGRASIVYFIVNDSGTVLYRYVDGQYRILLDTTLSVRVIHGGSADPME